MTTGLDPFMNRKTFIQANGAGCSNWRRAWSFVNEKEKFVIFGAWEDRISGSNALILSERWQFNKKGHKQGSYKQSREHIRLVEEEGFKLKIFPQKISDAHKDSNGDGPAKIDSYTPILIDKYLVKIGEDWFATDEEPDRYIAEEVFDYGDFPEGAARAVLINAYERSLEAREKCIEYYKPICFVCGFDFRKFYGEIGNNYIHVHHLIPLHKIGKQYNVDPKNDLRPVCANCHAMIHRKKEPLSIDELRKRIADAKKMHHKS